jgi:hypothetical protein
VACRDAAPDVPRAGTRGSAGAFVLDARSFSEKESAMSMGQDDPRRGEGAQAGDGVEKTATEASQGIKTGHIRWVLAASLLLVVIALGAAWMIYAASHPHPPPASASAQATMTLRAGGATGPAAG